MVGDRETLSSDQQIQKPRRPKSREVSSRFLSSHSSTPPSTHNGIRSPSHTLSPLRHSPRSSADQRKHRSLDHGLWPSSASTTPSRSSNSEIGALADHLESARQKDLIHESRRIEKSGDLVSLSRQRSCSEFNRFGTEKKSSKENHKPLFGGSTRFTGKIKLPGRSSSSSSKNLAISDDFILPGRLSVDENALRRDSFGQRSKSLPETQDSESEFESNDITSGPNFNSPVIKQSSSVSTWRKSGIEVQSKYLTNSSSKSRRWSSDSNTPHTVSSDNLPKKSTATNSAMKRANSLGTYYGRAMTKWALSPGRSGSPPMTVETKERPQSFSILKPTASPSKTKSVGNLITVGLGLFKSKKSSGNCSSPLGPGSGEVVHQLRLLQNRLVQWRYANARAVSVNDNIANLAENKLLYALDSLRRKQHSVLQKKLQLVKEKLEMKLNFIVHSQIKPLESWENLERQHLLAVSMIKDGLHSVVCKIPLIEGAKVELQQKSIELRHASDVAASIKSTLSTFSPGAEKTASMLSELAKVVLQEKVLLEECLELLRTISALEIQERSLQCSIIQLRLWQQQHQKDISSLTLGMVTAH